MQAHVLVKFARYVAAIETAVREIPEGPFTGCPSCGEFDMNRRYRVRISERLDSLITKSDDSTVSERISAAVTLSELIANDRPIGPSRAKRTQTCSFLTADDGANTIPFKVHHSSRTMDARN